MAKLKQGSVIWNPETEEVIGEVATEEDIARTARFVIGASTSGWTEKDCDYLCDGTADDVEINAAITALPATGGEIVILDGTYNITAKINVTKDNVSIRGNGNATVLKRMFNSSVEEGVITLTGRSGCKIADLQVDGNKTSYTNSKNYGICLNESSNNTVTGNVCDNNYIGIYFYDSSNNTVTGNTCNNNRSGIYLSSASNNTVTGNTCNNNGSNGIDLSFSSNNTVTGNTCSNNGTGIGLLILSSSNTVTGNTCSNNVAGIGLFTSSNNTVTGNTCIRGTGLATDYTESQHTIQLAGTGNNYNLISNNNCMGKAVTNDGGTGNTIIDNKWSNSSGRILESYSEKLVTLSGTTTTINLLLGNVFTHTLSGDTTYSKITNAVNGQAHSFTLMITQDDTVRTITFPASVKWQGGEIPDLSNASKTYVLTFLTVDGGTTWLGMFGGEF